MSAARKLLAFIKRGYLIESSYKAAFLLSLLTSVVPLVSSYFIGKLVDQGSSSELDRYGGSYFPFVLVGVGLTQFFNRALQLFSASIRRAQLSGVLEATLSSQTSATSLVLYDSAFSFLMASAQLLLVFSVGGVLLGADFGGANLGSLVVIAAFALTAFTALGVLAATSIVVLKKGDPVQFIFGSGAAVLSGAYFPVSVLPEPVQSLAAFLPMTHALEATRLALYQGASVQELAGRLFVLGAMGVVLLPTSLWTFHLAVEKGRREGTLLQY